MDSINSEYSAPLSSVIKNFSLKSFICRPKLKCRSRARIVNCPGLALSGFFGYFEPGRIQIIGNSEHAYMDTMTKNELRSRIEAFLSRKPVAIIYTTSLEINPVMLELCEKYEVPLLRTSRHTSEFMAALIASLNVSLAPRLTRHGVFVEVYGEGILILGDSGVRKERDRNRACRARSQAHSRRRSRNQARVLENACGQRARDSAPLC